MAKFEARLLLDCAWPEGGAAPALMPGYQKSLGRRTALGPRSRWFNPLGNTANRQARACRSLHSLQVAHAERFVFSCDVNFSLVEEMIRRDSKMRHGRRMTEATGNF